MRVLALVCLCTLVVAQIPESKPRLRFQFEKAREKLYNIPPPKHDNGLATRVSDCIAGKIRDHELCSSSVAKFTNHIQDMYVRASAIYQAEDTGRAAITEAEQEALKVTETTQPVDIKVPSE